jgi:2-polyprenyl-3-methyl-5-hydroxy-6-metoxy-1,4-benzoquinol methylase
MDRLGAMTLNAVWDGRPEEYDAHRIGWLAERRLEFIANWLPPGPLRVLEIGSGTGRLLLDLLARRPDLDAVGIEPLEGYVEYSRKQAAALDLPARYAVGTGEALAGALPAGFAPDVILTNDVLHHVADMTAATAAAAAACAPGARWLALEPNPRNPYVVVAHTLRRGEQVFDRHAFVAAASQAGWRLTRQGSLFLVPPQLREPPAPLVTLERALEHRPRLAGGIALELELG